MSLSPLPGSLLLTVLMRRFLCNSYLIGVSCRILYSFVGYLYVRASGSITSIGEEIVLKVNTKIQLIFLDGQYKIISGI